MPVETLLEECGEAMRLEQFSDRTVQTYLPVRRRSNGVWERWESARGFPNTLLLQHSGSVSGHCTVQSLGPSFGG